MSGHNKWSTIKHKKAASDAKKGKAFSRVAKEITIAAREGGGNPDTNARLRAALTSARLVNMPNDNVKRAIQKGTGEGAGATALEELVYEGYAAGGVAVLVHCTTDNRNRTAPEIRLMFGKNNGTLAASGAVSWMFKKKAKFTILGENASQDKLMELLLEADIDVEDIDGEEGEVMEIVAAPDVFNAIQGVLEGAGIEANEATVTFIPDNTCVVNDVSTARQVMRLLDALEDYDDAEQVISNVEIPDEIAEQLD